MRTPATASPTSPAHACRRRPSTILAGPIVNLERGVGRSRRGQLKLKKDWAMAALLAALTATSQADTIALSLAGDTQVDLWGASSLSGGVNPGYGSFPGTGAWPAPIQSPTGGDAYLRKVDNQANAAIGSGLGGPFPSGAGIYFGGFGTTPNTDGGTLGVVDTTPVIDLQTVTFQIQIGQAFGYDLLNNDLSLVKLKYTTSAGTFTLDSTYGLLLNRFYNGAVDMPTGAGGAMQPEDIYVNLWGLQWDLSSITGITSFEIQFTGVEHSSLAQLQLNQSSAAYAASAFPQDALWVAGGADAKWSTVGNWQGGAASTAGQNVTLTGGTSAVLDASQTVGTLTLNAADGFAVNSTGGAILNVVSGINGTASTAAAYTINAPVKLQGYSLIDLNANSHLTIAGPITGAGFYKQGDGSLSLTGNNVFDGNDSQLAANGLMIRGGTNDISGTNTLTGTGNIDFKIRQDTTVILHGGDNRLDSKFVVNLLASTSKLVLGDASGKSDLAVSGLAGAVGSTVVTGSKIVGGSAAVSTLAVDVASGGSREFGGNLGGAGTNENQLAFTKKGAGTQVLSGINTYAGPTRIAGGMLQLGSATALSANSNVQLDGGVLGLGVGDYSATLGTGAGQIQFVGDGGFAASGGDIGEDFARIPRTVTLNGGAGLTWGVGGFVGNGSKLILGHVTATNNVELTNAINLGSQARIVQVDNSATESGIDAQLTGELSGSGGKLVKTGAGTLQLTVANTYTGGTEVQQGVLILGGFSGSVRGNILLAANTTLQLANSGSTNGYVEDRIADNATVTMQGALLSVTNPSTAEGTAYSETIGSVVLAQGANTILTSKNNIVSATPDSFTLILGTLNRQAGATVHFSGASIGVNTTNQIFLQTAPTLDDGIIGGWATTGTGTAVLATEFVTYGANGLTALTAYAAYTAAANDTTWGTASNIKLNAGTGGGFTSTLTASRQINSLNMVGARTGTIGNNLDLGGNTLRVESGGIIGSGGATTRSNKINNGILTAGTGNNTAGELIVTASGATDIGAIITNNGTGAVSLVKAGTSTLTTTGNNTYTGGTTVNQGALNINGTNTGGGSLVVRKGATANVNGSLRVTGTLAVDGSVGGSGSLNFGAGTTLTGSGSVNQALTLGSGVGQLAKIAPGNSPGQLSTGSETWAAGGSYLWEIKDVDAGLGLGWDHLNITGTLSLTADNSAPFTLQLSSLTAADLSGNVADFNSAQGYSWIIATASGGITGFDASDFVIDTTGFTNPLPSGGGFSVSQSGNDVVLTYAVPEPTSGLLVAASGLWILGLRRRRGAVAA